MGIAEKLRIASEKCRYVQKDGLNDFHKYKFASAANILGHVNEALALAGAAIVDTDVVILGETGTGKERVVTAKVSITIRDTETEETATFRGIGSGQDAGDKAAMKATTAAQKYAWIVGLSIETGEDPEADDATDRHNEGAQKGQQRAQPAAPKRGAPTPSQAPQRAAAPARDVPLTDASPAEEAPPPPALARFYEAVAALELPGDAVDLWMKHRTTLAELPAPDRENAWKALCARTETVGKMSNAKVWLKRAIATRDAEAAANNNASAGSAA
jgi:hypothetical protein